MMAGPRMAGFEESNRVAAPNPIARPLTCRPPPNMIPPTFHPPVTTSIRTRIKKRKAERKNRSSFRPAESCASAIRPARAGDESRGKASGAGLEDDASPQTKNLFGITPQPPSSRNPPRTESSSRRVSRRRDGRPCCCALKPPARSVPASLRLWHVPPMRSGSCAT
jgi:hypothetical protein